MSCEVAELAVGAHSFRLQVETRYWHESFLFSQGTWEPEDAGFVLSRLAPGKTLVDVGANVGFYTVLGALAVGPRGRVLAVEPGGEAFGRLQANIALNGVEAVATARRLAVADAAGEVQLHLSSLDLGSSSCVNRPSPYQLEGVETVPAVTLDQLVEAEGLAPDFVKLDVEGMELRVLHGGRGCLGRHRPAIMLEINHAALQSAGTTAAEVLAELNALGYGIHLADGRSVEASALPAQGYFNLFALPR